MSRDDIRNRELVIAVRRGLLAIIDAIEIWLDYQPRTSELRKQARKR